MAAVAHLFGLSPPDPGKARILELGCASGGNILPLAVRFPAAQLTGIDLGRGQVAEGQRRISASGLDNIEISHGDIARVDLPGAAFDYPVVHGVWNWIPEEAQEAVFANAHRIHVSSLGLALDYGAQLQPDLFKAIVQSQEQRNFRLEVRNNSQKTVFELASQQATFDGFLDDSESGIAARMIPVDAPLDTPGSFVGGLDFKFIEATDVGSAGATTEVSSGVNRAVLPDFHVFQGDLPAGHSASNQHVFLKIGAIEGFGDFNGPLNAYDNWIEIDRYGFEINFDAEDIVPGKARPSGLGLHIDPADPALAHLLAALTDQTVFPEITLERVTTGNDGKLAERVQYTLKDAVVREMQEASGLQSEFLVGFDSLQVKTFEISSR